MLTLFGLAICFPIAIWLCLAICFYVIRAMVKMIRRFGHFVIGLFGIALCKGGMI